MHIPHENEESNFGMEGTKVTEYIMYVDIKCYFATYYMVLICL